LRDSFGTLVDVASNPFSYVGIPASAMLAPNAVGGLETRVKLDGDLSRFEIASRGLDRSLRHAALVLSAESAS
jgi:hypothetical protein